jgi:hypothetical protein
VVERPSRRIKKRSAKTNDQNKRAKISSDLLDFQNLFDLSDWQNQPIYIPKKCDAFCGTLTRSHQPVIGMLWIWAQINVFVFAATRSHPTSDWDALDLGANQCFCVCGNSFSSNQ